MTFSKASITIRLFLTLLLLAVAVLASYVFAGQADMLSNGDTSGHLNSMVPWVSDTIRVLQT